MHQQQWQHNCRVINYKTVDEGIPSNIILYNEDDHV